MTMIESGTAPLSGFRYTIKLFTYTKQAQNTFFYKYYKMYIIMIYLVLIQYKIVRQPNPEYWPNLVLGSIVFFFQWIMIA